MPGCDALPGIWLQPTTESSSQRGQSCIKDEFIFPQLYPSNRVPGVPEYRSTGVPEYQSTRVPEYQSTRVPE